MSSPDIRWKQRLSNFRQALRQLESAVSLSKTRELSDLEKQGIIQAFEFTHELAWNVMKDYFEYQGNSSITGSRDAAREAFQKGLIQNGEVWMEMIKSRNQTSHTYNEGVAAEIIQKITEDYFSEFNSFSEKMAEIFKKMILDLGLSEKTIQLLQEIFKKNEKILSVILYGSRAKGNFKQGSDIDLTVQAPELSLSDLLKIENEIDNLLLPYKVDLSLHHQIESKELLEHIERVGRVFYRK